MTTDIKFSNAEFYAAPSGQRIRVRAGETFTMELDGVSASAQVKWATINDPALSLTEVGGSQGAGTDIVEVNTLSIGQAEIQVQVNRKVEYFVTVEVFNDEAVALNPVAGEVTLK